MSKRIFTEKEKIFIKENYTKMETIEIAKMLNKTPKQIKGYADNCKIRKNNKIRNISDVEKVYILKYYNIKSTNEIGQKLNLTTKQVNDFAYRNGLRKNRKYIKYNDNYFSKIDSEDKAYWLGFLYADGCIRENKKNKNKGFVLEVGLSIKDKQHLLKFAKNISKDLTIKEKEIKNGQYKACRLNVCNTLICKDLISKGCIPRKSLILKFPSFDILNNKMYSHFIRGYFDGDGCVYTNLKNNSYKVSFVGTKSFIESIQNIVVDFGLNKTKIYKKGNAYQVEWCGKNNFKKWYNFLYSDSHIYLERKHDKFKTIL